MIGISSPDLSVMPFKEATELILPHFKLWEIVSEADHFLPDIQEELKELKETSGLEISIHAPYSDINLGAYDSKARNYALDIFTDILAISNDLDIRTVTMHPGKIGSIQSYDESRVLKYTREGLEVLDKKAAEYSVILALENMPVMRGTLCRTAEEIEQMLHSLEIKMCLDVGHANIASQMDEMLLLKSRFANVHMHDNDGTKDQHQELGKGTVDFTRVMKSLEGYTGNFVIENRTRDVDTAIRSRDFLNNIME